MLWSHGSRLHKFNMCIHITGSHMWARPAGTNPMQKEIYRVRMAGSMERGEAVHIRRTALDVQIIIYHISYRSTTMSPSSVLTLQWTTPPSNSRFNSEGKMQERHPYYKEQRRAPMFCTRQTKILRSTLQNAQLSTAQPAYIVFPSRSIRLRFRSCSSR